MPCSSAMVTDVISVRPDQTVEDALALFDKHAIRSVPVVNEKNQVIGLFNFSHLLKEILPVAVNVDDSQTRIKHMDISLDHLSGSAPWVAKRLGIVLPKKVEDAMITDPRTVRADTPLREGIRLLVKYGSPLPVVKSEGDSTLVGLISSQETVKALMEIASHLKNGKTVDE